MRLVEELTQSLMPLVAENGIRTGCMPTVVPPLSVAPWIGKNKFRDATAPVFKELYASVARGDEAQRSIDSNSQPDYRAKLEVELAELRDSEMWQAGKVVEAFDQRNNKNLISLTICMIR